MTHRIKGLNEDGAGNQNKGPRPLVSDIQEVCVLNARTFETKLTEHLRVAPEHRGCRKPSSHSLTAGYQAEPLRELTASFMSLNSARRELASPWLSRPDHPGQPLTTSPLLIPRETEECGWVHPNHHSC